MSFTTSKYVNDDCNRVGSGGPDANDDVSEDDFDACLERRIEAEVIKRCGCTQRLDADNASLPLCFTVHWDNLSLTERRLQCCLSGGRYLDSFTEASGLCPRPCQSVVYSASLIQSANLASAWQECWYGGAFMDTRMSEEEQQRQVAAYLAARPDMFNPDVCRKPWYHSLPYVRLKIVRQDFTTRTFNETLVLTSTALFAQVGAALAFYLGLTLTFLAEIVDLVLRLATLAYRWAAGKSSASGRASSESRTAAEATRQRQRQHRMMGVGVSIDDFAEEERGTLRSWMAAATASATGAMPMLDGSVEEAMLAPIAAVEMRSVATWTDGDAK